MKKIFMVILLSLAACFAYAQDNTEVKSSAFTDPSMPIEVTVGDNVAITIESNRSTGYEWQLVSPMDEKFVKFISSEYVAAESKTDMVGIPGKEVWIFKTVEPGKVIISLKYIRPFEKNPQPINKADFTVIIKEAPAPQVEDEAKLAKKRQLEEMQKEAQRSRDWTGGEYKETKR